MTSTNPSQPGMNKPEEPTAPLPPVPEAGTTSTPVGPYTSVPATPAGYSFQPAPTTSSVTDPYLPPVRPAGSVSEAPTLAAPSTSSAPSTSGASAFATPAPTEPFATAAADPFATRQAPTESYSTAPADPFATPGTRAPENDSPFGSSASTENPFPAYASAGAPTATKQRRRERRSKGPGWTGVIATSLVTALLCSGATAIGVHAMDTSGPTASTTSLKATTSGKTQTVAATGTSPDWEAVTNAVANSVVSITVASGNSTSMGSGVIYDSAGHVITNNHVVAGASRIQVTLADGRIYEAKLTGTDPATDLAVIALQDAPKDLTVAQFGDSSQVVTGEDVMAIGNPLGLSSTVTTGIVSAINRPVVTTQESTDSSDSSESLPGGLGELLRPQTSSQAETYTSAIQIDAAINPGNSGGPLFDETGKVIGITSSIAQVSQESGSIGLGFAIPGNLAVKIADQLIKSGKATHAYLGVTITDGGAQSSDELRAGAEVGTVESGSPADKAGLKKGDVIVAVNGTATSQAAALTAYIRQFSAGEKVTLTIIRDGKSLDVPVTLAERGDS